MKVVMTLLVRDAADVIDAHLAFHLSAGVDFVIATDNGSIDATTQILERYAREGHVHYISQPGDFSQVEVVTRMARQAATEFHADWVINSDADEFWWPRGGSLKEVLGVVPARFGSVRGMWRHFVPRPKEEGLFAERLTVRLCAPATRKGHTFSPHFKTAHRADPEVRVGGGNHEVFGRRLTPLRGWYPIDVLHFPVRSLEQCERKYVYWWTAVTRGGGTPDPFTSEAYSAHREGRMRELYASYLVDDEALAQGLCEGTLAIDTRLRDALRSLRVASDSPAWRFALPPVAKPLSFTHVEIDEAYVSELGALHEEDDLLRAQRRVEALEARVGKIRAGRRSRLRRAPSRPRRRIPSELDG